jgi:hypothetical protein
MMGSSSKGAYHEEGKKGIALAAFKKVWQTQKGMVLKD